MKDVSSDGKWAEPEINFPHLPGDWLKHLPMTEKDITDTSEGFLGNHSLERLQVTSSQLQSDVWRSPSVNAAQMFAKHGR